MATNLFYEVGQKYDNGQEAPMVETAESGTEFLTGHQCGCEGTEKGR
jgi:hypothetical protein